MSDAVEEAMDRVLGNPTTCPHGNPIPGSSYDAPVMVPLGRHLGRLSRSPCRASPRSSSSRPGLLDFLEESSILPGHTGRLTAASPDGTVTIEIEGRHVGVGSFASARILVLA